jgi:alpha-tubulin suppressor-like RCC1 family protein
MVRLVLALALAGCYAPAFEECRVLCGDNGACPDGTHCGGDGFCHGAQASAACPKNECTLGLANCDVNAICTDTPDSFTCACKPGFSGDGTTCLAAYVAVSGGARHTCAIRSDGSLWCWGDNMAGQLGDGTMTPRLLPTRVGSDSDWTAIAAGTTHTCGVRANQAFCWGQNDYGQLGNGTIMEASTPQLVIGGLQFQAVAVGRIHSCGIDASGAVYCWGGNTDGQLGIGTTDPHKDPQLVSAAAASSVAAGDRHTCAVFAGGVACWGDNSSGQLGDLGPSTNQPGNRLPLGQPITTVVAGNAHTCAVAQSGALFCWGANQFGQTAQTPTPLPTTPLRVGVPTAVSAAAAGAAHTCVNASGQVLCFGQNVAGQIGNGATLDVHAPTSVGNDFDPARAPAAGGVHSCAIRHDGGLLCWGSSGDGQIGDGTADNRYRPAQIAGSWGAVEPGEHHACAIALADRSLWCWGSNQHGQLGDGTNTAQTTPKLVAGMAWQRVSTGNNHSCGIDESGQLFCWGANAAGEIGDGSMTDRNVPQRIGNAADWVEIKAGYEFTCGLRMDHSLYCWGNGGNPTPTQVGAAGSFHQIDRGCGVDSLGNLQCWAKGGTLRALTVVDASMLWSSATAGYEHGCAIRTDQTLWCWGHNARGQLGTGDTNDATAPVQIGQSYNDVSAGSFYTCGLRGDQGAQILSCWGANDGGQLGDGTRTDSLTAEDLPTTFNAINAGVTSTCAMSDDKLFCWGDDSSGQLGIGAGPRLSPQLIAGFTP